MALDLRVTDQPAALAAAIIAAQIEASPHEFQLALSGGRTPWEMVERLATLPVVWSRVRAWQVDERVAPAGPSRNWSQLESRLPTAAHREPLPVDPEADPTGVLAARSYAARLAGRPLDLVHLGLGDDGHIASLFPGSDALDAHDDVVATGPHLGHHRVTLSLGALRRATRVLFLVTGAGKRARLRQLLSGDPSIPAGLLQHPSTIVVADAAAAP